MFKYFIKTFKKYIFITLATTILLLLSFSKAYADNNVFIVDKVETKGVYNLNFSREKYIDKAIIDSFQILTSNILLSKDLAKSKKLKIKKIKTLIDSFQILEEKFRKDEYKLVLRVSFNEHRVKKLLIDQNISFAQPKNISAIFFPILFVNNEIKSFDENYFYTEWKNITIKNSLINFILPIEDLDDISKIKEMKNKIEKIEVNDFVKKYNLKNYAFAFMDYNNKKLNIHLKTSFDNSKMRKNITYEIQNFKNKDRLNFILKDLKNQITDLWKEANIVNLLMPLSIKIRFEHKNLKNLDKFKFVLKKVNIIDKYTLNEFNINSSYFKIYYYGNPKNLEKELAKLGYILKDDRGYWEVYINE